MRPEEISYSIKNLLNRKLRSWLTVLSILIGVMSIFSLVSFGLGIGDYVNTLAAESGVDKLFLQSRGSGAPGTDDNFFLSADDVDFVSKVKGVKEVGAIYMKPAKIVHEDETRYSFLLAFDPHERPLIDEAFTVDIEKGRALKSGDMQKVVLGYNYQFEEKIFPEPVNVGDKISINDVTFEVVGFYSEVGNPSDDANIYITDSAFETLYPNSIDKYGFVLLRSQQGVDTEALADHIEDRLRKHKGQEEGEEDFYVQTFADAIATFGRILDIINGVLILIALISLVVASVNIMNTMYTAVLERTKEIGVMKSIGARNEDILSIFVFESGFLGAAGGVMGVIMGYIISSALGSVAKASGYALLRPIFPWYLWVGCVLFAFLVGAIAGILPALQASHQKPVDALRYE